MNKYHLGMILGRFQIFHKGHQYIIDQALELCDEVMVLIGSADKEGTYENPFSYETRKALMEEVYGEKIHIFPLDDLGVGNVPAWGDYVMDACKHYMGIPDLVIYGDEDKCREWYKNYPEIEYYKVSRQDVTTSSSELKKLISDNKYEEVKKWLSPEILKYYADIRGKLLKIEYKKPREESKEDFSYLEDLLEMDEE